MSNQYVIDNFPIENSQIFVAAEWLKSNRSEVVGAVIPLLKTRFGLSTLDAIEAAKLAHSLEYVGL